MHFFCVGLIRLLLSFFDLGRFRGKEYFGQDFCYLINFYFSHSKKWEEISELEKGFLNKI